MKKWFLLTVALVLAFSMTALAEIQTAGPDEDAKTYLARTGYDRLLVTDIFANEDEETDAKGDFPGTASQEITVQGCFGAIDMSQGEADPLVKGFDEKETFSLGLADPCIILMPPAGGEVTADPVACTSLTTWFDTMKTTWGDSFNFYATFELDEDGDLTRLEYVYMP